MMKMYGPLSQASNLVERLNVLFDILCYWCDGHGWLQENGMK